MLTLIKFFDGAKKRCDEMSIDIVFKFVSIDVFKYFYEKQDLVINLPHSHQNNLEFHLAKNWSLMYRRVRTHPHSNFFFSFSRFLEFLIHVSEMRTRLHDALQSAQAHEMGVRRETLFPVLLLQQKFHPENKSATAFEGSP